MPHVSTTPDSQKRTTKKQFTKFVKVNQLKQYKRLQLLVFEPQGDRYPLELSVELMSGKKVLLQMELLKEGKSWAIDAVESVEGNS